MHTTRPILLLSLFGLLGPFAPAASARQETWPQWRGPERSGLAPRAAWSDDLSTEHLALKWKVLDLGPSYSGPVVGPLRVYTTETVGEREEVVRAFDRVSGKELWRSSWEGAMKVPFFAAKNGSWIRSTPALDGDLLFVAGMRDVLACLDAESGDVRWTVDFVETFATELPPFGNVPSPLVDGEFVYAQSSSSIVKLRRDSGEIVWRAHASAEGMMEAGAFSSPVLAEVGGREHLLVQTRIALDGHDPDSGERLWSVPIETFRGMNILTPLPFMGGVYTSAYGGSSVFVEVVDDGEGPRAAPAWTARTQGYMTSPVLVEDHAYVFTRGNRLACVDLIAGEDRWTSPPTGDEYWSLAFQGDRILSLSDSGTLRLLRASPEAYEVLAERDLVEGQTWAHLAPAGDTLFVRELHGLYAFGWQ